MGVFGKPTGAPPAREIRKEERMRVRSIVFAAALVLALPLTGCAKSEDKPASTLTQAQRDTAIAKSDLPGADAVGAALRANGKEQAHATQVDTTGR